MTNTNAVSKRPTLFSTFGLKTRLKSTCHMINATCGAQTYQKRLLLATVACMILLQVPSQSFQQSFTDLPVLTVDVTLTGLDVAESLLRSGDFDGAKYAAEFAAAHFAFGLQNLRNIDAELTDNLHLSLLDLPRSIKPDSEAAAFSTIDDIISQLDRYDLPELDPRLTVVETLTVADEQYAVAIGEENEAAYLISEALFQKSRQLFENSVNSGTMLDLEQQSFFNDIEDAVASKGSFVEVGTLVGAIQRDLLGIDTIVHDQSAFYERIRVLYAELLESIDTGDYQKAEELAIEAYLENFEYLEPVLETVDAEFMYRLEIDMREDLRGMIKDNSAPEVIRSFLENSILPDLEVAETRTTAYLQENPLQVEAAGSQRLLKEHGDSTEDQQSEVRSEIDFIRDTLQEMLLHYENGDSQSAYVAARTAYLDSYEYVEIPLRAIDPDFTLEVEYQFSELRNLIKEQAPYEEVQQVSVQIKRNLDESERIVTGTGQIAPIIAFTASFSIIFREGLESVLILGAIITYLEASRNSRFKPYVLYGVGAAIAATAVTWVIASYVIEISGANRELIEAIAALSATAVLFYVSFWILNKIETKKWMEFVKAKVWQATTTGSAMVFVMLSFFTVYREGFESVLFYQAMFGFAKYLELYVALGFVVGIGSLLLVYFVMRKLGKKLPLRALFGLTMGIGAYLSIAFLGNAVRELQVLDFVPYTSMLGIIPRLDINLATMTGIYPTLETLISQLVLLSVYLTASFYLLILRPRMEAKLARMRKSRKNDESQQ